MKKKQNTRENDSKQENKKPTTLYVIFKRCGKASDFLRIPHKDQKLQLASFENIDMVEKKYRFRVGDVINTTKSNQLLVVYVSEVDPTSYFNIEKSSFTPNSIVARDILDNLDQITIYPKPEKKVYVINKRPFSISDIKDLVKTLGYPDNIIENIKEDDQGEISIPIILYNLLSILKEDLFLELIEDA